VSVAGLKLLSEQAASTCSLAADLGPYIVLTADRRMAGDAKELHAFAFNRSAQLFEVIAPYDAALHAPKYLPGSVDVYLSEYAGALKVRPWTGDPEQLPGVLPVLNSLSHVINWLRRDDVVDAASVG